MGIVRALTKPSNRYLRWFIAVNVCCINLLVSTLRSFSVIISCMQDDASVNVGVVHKERKEKKTSGIEINQRPKWTYAQRHVFHCVFFWHKPFQCYSYVRSNRRHYPHHFPDLWPQMRYPNRHCQTMNQFFYNFADLNAAKNPNDTNNNMIHLYCGTFDRMAFRFRIHSHRIHSVGPCNQPDTGIARALRISRCCDTVIYKLLQRNKEHENKALTCPILTGMQIQYSVKWKSTLILEMKCCFKQRIVSGLRFVQPWEFLLILVHPGQQLYMVCPIRLDAIS